MGMKTEQDFSFEVVRTCPETGARAGILRTPHSVIETPVFPRWVWMEEITYSHIPIATLITAFMVLAPIYEYIGYRRNDLRYDRLGKGLIWFAMILFSPGAALGTGIPVFLIGAYPEFWFFFLLLLPCTRLPVRHVLFEACPPVCALTRPDIRWSWQLTRNRCRLLPAR